MNQPSSAFPWRFVRIVLVTVCVVALFATSWRWWPTVSGWVQGTIQAQKKTAATEHDHEGHGGEHDHAGHSHAHEESTSVELSKQARLNLGLSTQYVQPVKLQSFQRMITVPAVIVDRPGRTNIKVATPLTGVIEHVHAVTGEAVRPGTLLFEIKLTHEDLVQTQTDFLRALGELDVENREIQRLTEVAQSGAVAGKSLLERQYAKDKLEALLKAQREALRLHGLSNRQVDEISQQRHLLRELEILVPSLDSHGKQEELRLSDQAIRRASFSESDATSNGEKNSEALVIEQLDVQKGQSVAAGEQLCILADYSRLYIEGKAFEQDSQAIGRAVQNGWTLTAVFSEDDQQYEQPGLKLAFVANAVDPVTRTLSFYVNLPNAVVRDERNEEGQRFISWKYRTGQRLDLQVPVEEWSDQIVVPVDAVVKEGAESYVFQENGDHFDRIPVHVKYRDQRYVVIANDGSLYPGDVIALKGAHQLQMALKNKSGGGVDPHAGHNH